MPTTSSPTSSRRSRAREGLALALWAALAGLFVLAAFYGAAQEDVPEDALYDPDLAVNGAFFYGLMLAISIGIAYLYPRPWQELGFRRFGARWVWIAFGVVLLTLVVGRILEPYLHGGEEQGFAPERWEPEHATAFVVNSLLVITLGPFAEEVFFRGLGVRALAVFGAAAAIVVSGVIFGLVHGILGALPPLALFGIGLAWVRVGSGSVWPGVIAHVTYNGLGILLLVLAWALDVPLE
ncbi:MAG: lysostaphin resistance A-like protein [Gaiellaceae bacterium]